MPSQTRPAGGGNGAGGSGASWSTASLVTVSDDSYATVGLTAGQSSKNLVTLTHGFAVPAGSRVDGVEVSVERSADAAGVTDLSVQLRKLGALQGTNKAAAGDWPGADAVVVYGGPGDLWGLSLSPKEVNAGTFGAGIQCQSSGDANANVDFIAITVYYTLPQSQPSGSLIDPPGRSIGPGFLG